MKRPLKVGLTGGIGSGKSTVATVFEVLHIPVFYADTVARKLINSDPVLRHHLVTAFGEETYTGNELNRAYLASIVFNDPKQLEHLNAITHPAAIAAAERWFAQQTSPYAVKEAALLFESGSAAGLDYIIGVSASQPVRISRTMKRDNITSEQVLARMDKQMDEAIKMERCDFIIINDEQQMILPQVLKLHETLLALSES